MPTIPTGKLELELRRLYMQWVNRLPQHENDLHKYVAGFEAKSTELIEKMGGQVARLGALADFPAPKRLDLSPHVGTIYSDMELAAIQAQIGLGLNPRQTARALTKAGVDKSFRRLERLARTETVRAYWKNSWDSIADLPELVMVWGSEDGPRTCAWCKERDGLVMDSSSLRDHPNGRCTPLPTHRSMVDYRGSIRDDGTIYTDPAWGKPVKPLDVAETKGKSESPTVKPIESVDTGPKVQDYSAMGNNDKIKAAETMYGTGSKQHKQAISKWGAKDPSPLKTPAKLPTTDTRVIKSMKDMDDFAKSMPAPSTLTKNAATIVDDYAKGSAYASNAHLRGQKTYRGRAIDARTKAYTKKFTKEMDQMMDLSLVPEDVRVVRALGADSFGGIDELKKLVGKTYTDKGYMSTSLAEKVSSSVYNVADAVEMQITVPKGTRAVYMAGESYLRSERELLLDRMTNLNIESVIQDPRTKKWKVIASVIPGPR